MKIEAREKTLPKVELASEALQDICCLSLHLSVESGGLLVGGITEKDGKDIISIDKILPIMSSDVGGASYEIDTDDYVAKTENLPAKDNIGWFHTHPWGKSTPSPSHTDYESFWVYDSENWYVHVVGNAYGIYMALTRSGIVYKDYAYTTMYELPSYLEGYVKEMKEANKAAIKAKSYLSNRSRWSGKSSIISGRMLDKGIESPSAARVKKLIESLGDSLWTCGTMPWNKSPDFWERYDDQELTWDEAKHLYDALSLACYDRVSWDKSHEQGMAEWGSGYGYLP